MRRSPASRLFQHSQILWHDVPITALPALDKTGCAGTGQHKQLLPASGFVLQVRGRWHHPFLGWKHLCPAALSRLAHLALAAYSPEVSLAGRSGLLQQLKNWKKMEGREDIQYTDKAKT